VGNLRPLLNERAFSADEIIDAHAAVEAGALGKVVINL
jgi:hypothetical protein